MHKPIPDIPLSIQKLFWSSGWPFIGSPRLPDLDLSCLGAGEATLSIQFGLHCIKDPKWIDTILSQGLKGTLSVRRIIRYLYVYIYIYSIYIYTVYIYTVYIYSIYIYIHIISLYYWSIVAFYKNRMSISFRILITSRAMTAEDCNPSRHA